MFQRYQSRTYRYVGVRMVRVVQYDSVWNEPRQPRKPSAGSGRAARCARSLCSRACVAVLPGPGLALSIHQEIGFPAGCPWRTERASGARRPPGDASTEGTERPKRAASRGAPSAARAFEVYTSSQTFTHAFVPYTPCTDRFSIAEYKVCEPLYDTLAGSINRRASG